MSADDSHSTNANFDRTVASVGHDFSKEQQDIALAVVVLRSGLLSERQLSAALATWTIHGSVALGEHLRSLGLIDEAQQRRLAQQAAECLDRSYDVLEPGNGAASKSVLLGTLDALDPTGAVARLMGIRAVVGAGAADSTGVRQAAARYRLVRKLGQGGLGRVWLAFDEQLKRHVAVKEITASDAAALERFRREAEITGRLEHPGIVPIYQLGDDVHSGEAFYAMRFLGKRTLHDAILEYHERRSEGNDDPMIIRQLLTDFVNICQALGHAHSRKVIHRDLKPENIAIDSFGQVIVIDWGIAKVIDEIHLGDVPINAGVVGESTQSTLQGQVLGTPLYMAPEQAAGRIDELDERTDIYGLGAILFAILTGCAPHEHTRDISNAANARELLTAISSRPTPHARDVNPHVDEALAAICAKAMARRQYARYQTASELADNVQRWMAGEPVAAHRERPSQRLMRWIQHHRIWSQVIAASAIIGFVSLATLGIATHQGRIAERHILFDELRAYEREIEVQLTSTADDLAQDTQFMSTLPPIQGIMDARARSGAGEDANVGAGTSGRGEDEVDWRGRLETIFEGFLRANPDYIAIAFTEASDAAEGRDVVRVERNFGVTAYVRRVPAGRLGSLADAELSQRVATLSPGDVAMVIRNDADSGNAARHGVRLIAATPVYDETTGSLFGIVLLESDLLRHVVQFLERIDQNTAEIFVTDASGVVWVREDAENGVDIPRRTVNVTSIIPDLSTFFSAEDEPRKLDEPAGWMAAKVQLDATNDASSVGVVLRLRDSGS